MPTTEEDGDIWCNCCQRWVDVDTADECPFSWLPREFGLEEEDDAG